MARSPSRRDDDRHRRDDRDYRRRSRDRDVRRRSRSPAGRDLTRQQRRYDDHDRNRDYPPRRDRSRDRHYDGRRRDDSRERKRPRDRDRSPVREKRQERYRDDHREYDDDRDRKRPRRTNTPPPSRRHRDDSKSRMSTKSGSLRGNESPRSSTTADAAKDDLAAKQARVEAWKKKMLEKQSQRANVNGAASPQVAIKSEEVSSPAPAVASPATSHSAAKDASPAIKEEEKTSSPVPYAGKFDPKAIAKRAAAAIEKQRAALGGDVVIPKSATEAAHLNGSSLANNSKVAPSSRVEDLNQPANGSAKISGFDLNKATAEKSDKPTSGRPAANLGEDDEVKRKFEKLPDIPVNQDAEHAALANGEGDQEDEGDDLRDEEEEAEAVREAAQRRAEEAQAEQEDTAMANLEDAALFVVNTEGAKPFTAPTDVDVKMDDEEEVDPLEAFMNDLTMPVDNSMPNLAIGKSKKKQPQIFNSDDEGDLDAVGDSMDDIMAITAKRKKKDIPTVDHSKVEYEPFRKNFYSESVELAEMDAEEVALMRADMDNIAVRGKDVPKPITNFAQGGLGSQTLNVIREMKFEKPTAIQSQALPAIMSGRDVIGVAKTGSGKTVAFILPMFRHIKDQRPLANLDGPIGLILAPTRELATQIHRDCKPYLKALNLRAVCAYGGSPIKDQIAELKRGAEIIVCTPGRLIDLLAANAGRVTNLKRVTYVVLDEADRMFDMGFEPQITKVLNNIRPDRQTVLFSATFPKNMEALARKALHRPLEIQVGGRSVVAPEITQIIEVRSEDSKFYRLLELLGDLHEKDEDARSLIFVERQETADSMLKDLLKRQYPSVSIHGGREQMDRDQAISDFRAGIYPVMVATSVAARGLDVKQLKLVINFDCPNHAEDYVHRVGRTGRAGNTGTAVTFITPEQDRFAVHLIRALKDSKQEIPEPLKKLEESHHEKVKAGQAQKAGSGFGGKGIERLDAARDAERAWERKQYKTGDEPEEEEEKEEKKADAKTSEVDKLVAKAAGAIKDREAQREEVAAEPAPSGLIPTALNDHLSNAMKVSKAEIPAPSASRPAANDPLAKVSAAVASINSRLGAKNSTRPGVPIDNRGPDAGAFHATLEINDFPQKARWGVTNRTNVAKILEATGTSITTKGNYYAEGKQPEPNGQPKLYILVEGDTEVVVENAMRDLTRLLREGTIAAMDATNKAPASGRYSVV